MLLNEDATTVQVSSWALLVIRRAIGPVMRLTIRLVIRLAIEAVMRLVIGLLIRLTIRLFTRLAIRLVMRLALRLVIGMAIRLVMRLAISMDLIGFPLFVSYIFILRLGMWVNGEMIILYMRIVSKENLTHKRNSESFQVPHIHYSNHRYEKV